MWWAGNYFQVVIVRRLIQLCLAAAVLKVPPVDLCHGLMTLCLSMVYVAKELG